MSGYEEDIARQPGGPFTQPGERRLIRCVAEHWLTGERYKAERGRRLALYAKWIGIGGTVIAGVWKLTGVAAAVLGKGV